MNKSCYHGGAFFTALGPEFNHLKRRHDIINADVLDAWFDPSPKVIAALTEELPWLLRTSPPTHCEGMERVIARARGVAPENILPGAGSSDLIFLTLREWLRPAARVLLLDPTYGEYAHVLEQVIGCRADRMELSRAENYRVDPGEMAASFRRSYDLVVIVNPNSPTGQHIARAELEQLLIKVPARTRVWIDETYVEYAGPGQSLESFAATSPNVVVCKSMSKVYALSGARAAYLCGPEAIIRPLRALAPPWAVSLPGQVAAVAALQDPDYYTTRWAETHILREELAAALAEFDGWDILSGIANFILCHLPEDGPDAATLVRECRRQNLFLRDADAMGRGFNGRAIRIAVKDPATNRRIHNLLAGVTQAGLTSLAGK